MKSKSEIDQIVDRWCDALESGAYEQGKALLNIGNRFCCLGVLCDLLRNEYDLEVTSVGDETFYDSYSAALPSGLAKDLGMGTLGGFSYGGSGYFVSTQVGDVKADTLADANDDGATFPQIAAAIRANKHLLFKAYRDEVAQ